MLITNSVNMWSMYLSSLVSAQVCQFLVCCRFLSVCLFSRSKASFCTYPESDLYIWVNLPVQVVTEGTNHKMNPAKVSLLCAVTSEHQKHLIGCFPEGIAALASQTPTHAPQLRSPYQTSLSSYLALLPSYPAMLPSYAPHTKPCSSAT